MRVQLCGPLVIERGEERLESRLPGRQGRLLFAYLTVNRHRLVSRHELGEALWPEPPAATDSALNALLSKLRRALGADAVDGRSSLRLLLGDAWIDIEAAPEAIHRAESAVALADWRRAWGPSLVALFVAEREFLPGEDLAWIDDQRRRLAEIRLRALECYAVAGLGLGGTELAAPPAPPTSSCVSRPCVRAATGTSCRRSRPRETPPKPSACTACCARRCATSSGSHRARRRARSTSSSSSPDLRTR
jgi:SARP family transcriptional regulator, regulator of embCAB operon